MSSKPNLNVLTGLRTRLRTSGACAKEVTRGLGGPRVKDDWRVREAEGGFCAPVCKENVGANQRFRGEKEEFSEGVSSGVER
jgi:hypothetical protein